MKLSITKAAQLAGVSRTTLYNDMKSGKLSFELQGKKKKTIDISELERVYGQLEQFNQNEPSKPVKTEQKLTGSSDFALEIELAVLRDKLEIFENERKREQEKTSDEIEHLRGRLEKADNERVKLTAILTDQREGQGTQKNERDDKIEKLESVVLQLQKQNNQFMEREEARRKRAEERRRLKEEEESRGFWRRFLGK
ncbi:MAG: hypothetical protein P1U70_06120 [Saprospiraceae bacterium]|jgi:hypothetical protein|nr:hypothetical protein [Saprospiraceae bacterium]